MPVIESSYVPSFYFKSGDLNTIFKTLTYRNKATFYRKRIKTPDDDFLDLDFLQKKQNHPTLVIAMHGLEGSSNSSYIDAICCFLKNKKCDVLALNFRGCSGEDNKKPYSYHSGKTDDLAAVISYIEQSFDYKNLILLGYSMGGNITLKYLGEKGLQCLNIKAAVAISVPCDLQGSSTSLSRPRNFIYLNRFMKTLRKKAILKLKKFPSAPINRSRVTNAKDFKDFDDAVTAPLFGFKNAEDYWTKSSSKQFLKNIQVPTLLINALDDSFLDNRCYPYDEARSNPNLYLETPKYGGHVGFNSSINKQNNLWLENRILKFIEDLLV